MTTLNFSPPPILTILELGAITLQGLLPWSSNYTFLLRVCHENQEVQAVYKPRHGERPLWDFPTGTLCSRERAAFLISDLLGWNLVPPTILREGPHGLGSIQWFIPHDPQIHYFTLEGQFPEQEQRFVLFDALANNADRKAGHILLGEEDHLWGIDHGICFHEEYKLRTVIWAYAGIPIPPHLLTDLQTFQEKLKMPSTAWREEIATLLSHREIKALENRVARLCRTQTFPDPGPGRHYPWPLV